MKRTEAGRGGRKGHSNMSHWSKTAEVKRTARRWRRLEDRFGDWHDDRIDPCEAGTCGHAEHNLKGR